MIGKQTMHALLKREKYYTKYQEKKIQIVPLFICIKWSA